MIKVLKPGLQTTVQDLGRSGYYAIAIPPSGVMDTYSYTVANLLVGNDTNAAALEITYMGPELEFGKDATIAVTGGDIPPKINGNPIPTWETVEVKEGDKLSFDYVKSGARVYLAIAGGIDVPIYMGSRSTNLLCGIGGYEGRALQQGDLLPIGTLDVKPVQPGMRIPESHIPQFSKLHEVRVLLGLCSYRFTEESKDRFFNVEWKVTPDANRVGYRLKGERLDFVPREQPFGAGSNPSNVIDNWYPLGSIQIPDGVEPIVLLKDAVTAGGFVTIGAVIQTDLNIMAQIKINESIHFVSVTLEEALEARRDLNKKICYINQLI